MASKNSVEILIRARDGATKTLEEVRDGVKGVGTEARAGVRPLQEYREELKHQATELERVAKSTDKTTDEYRAAVDELARVKGELKSVNTELRTQETAWTKLGSQMTGVGAKLSLGLTAPLTALAGWGVSMAMELETFQASLDVLIGDGERAKDVFDELYEFSASTPFQWDSLTAGTRTLAAFQIEAEQIIPTLSQIGDIAAGLQVPIEDLAQIYGRVHVTGRLGMEEVNRLADRGVPIYTELGRVLGVTEGEIRDLVSAGMVGFPELEAAFQNLTAEGGMFFGMMDAQLDTVAGRLNTLRDNFGIIVDIIGQHLLPVFDAMIGHAQRAVDWFVELDESTQGLFVGLGVVLAAAGPVLVGIGTLLVQLPRLIGMFQLLRTTLLPFLGPAGILAGAVAGYIALNNAMDAGREPRQKAQESFDNLIASMVAYRQELVVTSEAERQEAIEALNRQRRVLEITIANQQAFVRSVEADVIAFANKGFFGQLFSFGEANVNIKTLEQAEQHLGVLQDQLGDIDTSIERIASLEIPGPKSDVPKLTEQVKDLGDATKTVAELPDPEEAVQSWASAFIQRLQAGVEQARAGWRDTLTNFGVITGTLLRDAFGVDQPDSELVVLGRDIVTAIGDGIEEAFPSLGIRLTAGITAIKDQVAAAALEAYVTGGGALRTPETTYTPLTPGPYVPELIGIGGRPIPRDVAGLENNIAQMSEAMFGPRSAAGRFLVDLEALFGRAAREMARTDRVAAYQRNINFERGQDARFGSDESREAYHRRIVTDPRYFTGPTDLTGIAPTVVVPGAVPITAPTPIAQVPAPVALGVSPSAQVLPDLSHLDDEQRSRILAEEMAARQELIAQLTTMSTENGPLANFGAQLLSAAAEAVPAFGAALNGFVQAGPIGAIIGFFSELLMTSEPMQEAFLAINEALAPLGELLGRIIAPALKLLATVIGWVVDALVAIYNFLLGWLFGRIERQVPEQEEIEVETPTPRTYEHSDAPPAAREMDFGRVSPGVQLAVATPLLEAAQLQLSAAQLQVTAANSLLSVIGRMEAMYDRVLSEGFRVIVQPAAPAAATSSSTAYLR